MPYDARAHMRAQRWQFYPTVPTIHTHAPAHAHGMRARTPYKQGAPSGAPARHTYVAHMLAHFAFSGVGKKAPPRPCFGAASFPGTDQPAMGHR